MTRKYASFDTSQVRAVAADFGNAPARISRNVTSVMFKSAQNIKKSMRAQARERKHWHAVAGDITFDIEPDVDGVSAEIGPEIGRSGRGHQGSLAFIAYNGSSRGGGGTIRDPEVDLMEELPAFERFMEAAAIKALG
ncbi:hypothetical protein [Demequina globuliformis]|uniref:hypothetical protein n=1 Tax=Demequina globuliformis TaxID=676202 RepID=UPI0007809AC9|nr:hypothetical protein [Demequina globuliformis]